MGCNLYANGNAFEAMHDTKPPERISRESATEIVMDLVNYYESAGVQEMFGKALINLQLNPESWMKEVIRVHDDFIRNGALPPELVALHKKLGLGNKVPAVD